jgi:hypothetical protein
MMSLRTHLPHVRRSIAAFAVAASCGFWATACGVPPLDIANYDRSCQQASDCVAVYIGGCSGCLCPNTAINRRSQAQYEEDFMMLECTGEACPCVPVPPTCKAGQCAAGGP